MKDWYERIDVLFEIVKQLKNKEVALLGDKRVRCILAQNLNNLKSNIKGFEFFKKRNNLYLSLATFDFNKFFSDNKDLFQYNFFTFAHAKRRIQQDKFNEVHNKYITGYDFGIDFDAHEGDTKQAYNDCKSLKDLFDSFGIPYFLKSSGSGFHITIEYKDFPKQFNTDPINKIRKFSVELRNLLRLVSMDVGLDDNGQSSGFFYDSRRLFKIAYSLDVKTGNVALPLTNNQFNNFSQDMLKPENIMCITNRGLLKRPGSSENITKMIKDLGITI